MNRSLLFFFIMLLLGFTFPEKPKDPHPSKDEWVEKKLAELSLDQKIGQLFMIRAHSNLGPDHIAQVENQIKKYEVGGLCFFQGSPLKQAELTNQYQSLSKIPLLIAIDGEWGLGMRFPDSAISFPRQLMLGAIQDNHLIYDMGKEIANQMKRIGIHVNFAPVVDVNNNADNPVINDRSFGENRNNVASKSYAFMKGMQDNGLIACAKHFPGHGDTNVDSHYDLPIINHDLKRLDSIELMPFKLLVDQGIKSVMVAHLHVPAIDDRANRPTVLSSAAINGILKDSMGFEGLIFTDALEMKGVTKNFPSGELEAEAIVAGNDFLCLPVDLPIAFETIKDYVSNGKITEDRLDESVRKILMFKYEMGLTEPREIKIENLEKEINNNFALALKKRLITKAITLVRDDESSIPLDIKPESNYASLSIGSSSKTIFQNNLERLSKFKSFQIPKNLSSAQIDSWTRKLEDFDKVVVGFHDMSKYSSKNFGIDESSLQLLNRLKDSTNVIITLFGSPYSLKYFDNFDKLVVAYNEDPMTQEVTAKAIMGEQSFSGKLPVSAGRTFHFGEGLERRAMIRMGFAEPENVGMSTDSLAKIEKLVNTMIKKKAAPGCQILIAKDGKIVYHKAFGYHTYEKKRKVKLTDVYDLASITKIAATTISVMKLNEEGKLNIGSPLSLYVPQLDTTNKKDLKIYDIMAHHSGLIGWIPFYRETVSEDKVPKPLNTYYASAKNRKYKVPVADDLFMRTDYVDSIWNQIYSSELRENNNYRYSDLGFYLLSQAILNTTGKSINEYAEETFYAPLGLQRTLFNPLDKLSKNEIVPSEFDTYFRRQKIQGFVHDMGSAMLGGISGHAGLFSNAYELGIIMQMLLNGGYYGDRQFLKPETIRLFTQRHPRSSRRGIGFDMKELNEDKRQMVSEKSSDSTFGHTGFTGTYAFVDPDYNLVFIMLANRTYPSMNNNKYIRENYRQEIHTIVYDALGVPDEDQKQNN